MTVVNNSPTDASERTRICPACGSLNGPEAVFCFIGKPHFFDVHQLWFAVWMVVNAGILAMVRSFDPRPFGLPAIIPAMETIFITGFVLIRENLQSAHANSRVEMVFEANVRTKHEPEEMKAPRLAMAERKDSLERRDDPDSPGDDKK